MTPSGKSRRPVQKADTKAEVKKITWPELSVVIPAYNESGTLAELVRQVRAVPLRKEIIVVDDASTDGTDKVLAGLKGPDLRVIRQPRNLGKGAALRAGFQAARNEVIVVQDADLEYDPTEYTELVAPIARGQADVVYGSRFFSTKGHRVHLYWHYVMNRLLTMLCNMFSNLNLTDMETCYKAFRRGLLAKLKLKEKRFGFEPEVTIKLARTGARFYEIGISYHGRSYGEGKKIKAKDGLRALYCIFRYGIFG